MHRRDLLNSAMVAGAASVIRADVASAAESRPQPARIADSNVTLFQWPFRRLPLDEVPALLGKYETLGITEAWACSFEAILHRDIGGVNERLAAACRLHLPLVPVGAVNPTLPDWEQDLRRCSSRFNMPGIRLYPNYHGYGLGDPRVVELVKRAATAGLFIQIAVAMEDTRTQHVLVQVPDVDLTPLVPLAKSHPAARIQILNYRPRGPIVAELGKIDNVFMDTARVDATDGVAALIRSFSASRVLFGTHAPFLIPDASLIRVHESDLADAQLQALMSTNATTLMTRSGRVNP